MVALSLTKGSTDGMGDSPGVLRGNVALTHQRSDSIADTGSIIGRGESRSPFAFANHLVMVAGHAVLDNDRCDADLLTDAAWVLLDYQRNQGSENTRVCARTHV